MVQAEALYAVWPVGMDTENKPLPNLHDRFPAPSTQKCTLRSINNTKTRWKVNSMHTACKKLDEAVFVAHGWKSDLGYDEILEKLLSLNLERGR